MDQGIRLSVFEKKVANSELFFIQCPIPHIINVYKITLANVNADRNETHENICSSVYLQTTDTNLNYIYSGFDSFVIVEINLFF